VLGEISKKLFTGQLYIHWPAAGEIGAPGPVRH
jgi:hypothetical protein